MHSFKKQLSSIFCFLKTPVLWTCYQNQYLSLLLLHFHRDKFASIFFLLRYTTSTFGHNNNKTYIYTFFIFDMITCPTVPSPAIYFIFRFHNILCVHTWLFVYHSHSFCFVCVFVCICIFVREGKRHFDSTDVEKEKKNGEPPSTAASW